MTVQIRGVRDFHQGPYQKQKYRDYAPRNDFIPLVADSVGRIGGHALEFFSRAAGALTAGSVRRGGPNLDSAWQVFNKLRLRFLAESLEATSFRMLHGATAGQRARTSESGPSQPPSSAPSQLGETPPQPVNGPQGGLNGLFPCTFCRQCRHRPRLVNVWLLCGVYGGGFVFP